MPKKRPQPERPGTQLDAATPKPIPPIPAEAALSFLKDTKGALTWSAGALAETLKTTRREAEQAIALLTAQPETKTSRSRCTCLRQYVWWSATV